MANIVFCGNNETINSKCLYTVIVITSFGYNLFN